MKAARATIFHEHIVPATDDEKKRYESWGSQPPGISDWVYTLHEGLGDGDVEIEFIEYELTTEEKAEVFDDPSRIPDILEGETLGVPVAHKYNTLSYLGVWYLYNKLNAQERRAFDVVYSRREV